jgi:predicted RNA-binding Zn-ribbon protein involved in translation (DUF1610 family)/DNA polymerase elongation subunit (family B)
MANNGPKVLIYDIETTHNIVAAFDLYPEMIPHDNILQERFIVCACWQWLGEKKVHSVSVLDDPARFKKDHTDDYVVVKKLHELFSEADVIVAHYGDAFDYPYVQSRSIFHGFKPTPPVTSVDTKKIAKGRFRFNSNRLDYLGKFLGLGGKIHTDNSLWLGVLKGDRKSIEKMVTYNKRDVDLLLKVFKKLAPYIPSHVNRELFGGHGCPRCGSTKIQSRGTHRAISKIYQRYQCQACGGWFKEFKSTVKTTTKYRVL